MCLTRNTKKDFKRFEQINATATSRKIFKQAKQITAKQNMSFKNIFTNHHSNYPAFIPYLNDHKYFMNLTRQYNKDLENIGNREEIFKNKFKF